MLYKAYSWNMMAYQNFMKLIVFSVTKIAIFQGED